MKSLPLFILIVTLFLVGNLLVLNSPAFAITIASQTQNYSDQLTVWDAIQESGSNLSGILSSLTFRVYTSSSNLNQFDFTALNTRIYDKDNNNSSVIPCVPSASDPLSGLSFSTTGVPSGFEDVTIDFSCRNYNFIQGHRYLIQISNANMAQFGGKRILLAAAAYGPGGHGGSSDLFTGGGLRYAFDNGFCSATSYVWNSQTSNNGCNPWTSTRDDLYFVLNNNAPPPPPPRLPVIFIPGIGGSEMKASQDIIWSAQDGHGGTYSHAYATNEKIWVNQDEAVKLGDDDYFDVLRLKADGQTQEASLGLTGDLTPFGYSDIDSFFTGMGYSKGTNFFVFAYDWRKDVRSTKDNLDSLIEEAKQKSGQTKVNIVVHSLGGLIARNYISDTGRAAKVNKLIELGVPHLGAVYALKSLMYGAAIAFRFKLFEFPIIPASEINDVLQNLPSAFQLLPSTQYFSFYNNSDKDRPYPFRDDRDIDNNNVTGVLNYDQTKTLLNNLGHNMAVFGLAEQFHSSIDPILNQTNGVKIYEIVGSSQPTLGQIQETWWITWPINLIPKQDEIFINGDDTVTLYSAALKSDSLDISGAFKLYYVEQKHSDLVNKDGSAMQTVKSILNDDNALPIEVKNEKIDLEGQQLSLDDGELQLYDDEGKHTGIKDDGEIETNIPETFYSTSGKTKHAFVKKKSKKVTARVTRNRHPERSEGSNISKTTSLKIRHYKQDKVSKTAIYKDISINEKSKVEFISDPTVDISPNLTLFPDSTKTESINLTLTSEATGSAALDQTPPSTKVELLGNKDSSGVYTGPVTVSLTGNDLGAGILRIEYSLDNGQTVQTYTVPFIISTPGKTTLQVKSIDKLGNEEIPQIITIEIAVPPSPTPTPTTSSNSSTSGISSSTSLQSTSEESLRNTSEGPARSADGSLNDSPGGRFDFSEVGKSQAVLGISFKNPVEIAKQIEKVQTQGAKAFPEEIINQKPDPRLSGLLIVSGGILTLVIFGLITRFFIPWKSLFLRRKATLIVKQFPK